MYNVSEKIDLRGKCCIVVGAGGGIGLAITQLLLERGASVLAVSRSISGLKRLEQRFHGMCSLLKLEIVNYSDAVKVAAIGKSLFVKVDLFFNSIGTLAYKSFHHFTESEIRKVIESNLLTSIFLTHTMLPMLMHKNAFVIQVGSLAGIT